ncbi:MAG: UDP-2-acetamido-2-deoxy-ribo-hexuluronate aminotransferase [Desulfobacteraceae bacterium Eth-SRB2]|nr:MAG: UDP-2-acetamido-2-deoxy-ribo-hexuluronate aminotransferase [Desulfobacteraceae bacterium Eth-SRB2]
MQFIDLSAQQKRIRSKIESRINHVLDHGKYIMGPEVKELEEKLSAFVGTSHCITCSSGTDALLIALMALDIGPGDEVITVPYTWISSAEVIALLNAKPVFVDIQPDTFNMDPDLIEAAITPHTKAIMPVSIYGQCANMTRINAIAAKHNIPVIEDGAQSFGATHYGKKSCGLSTSGCTSFFPSKPLGCYGDGGAVFTNDDSLAEKMRQIRVHGQMVKHQHPLVGINGRLDTLQAAILLEKLEIFPEECSLRWEVGQRYNKLFSGISGIQVPVIGAGNDSVYAQYTLLTEVREKLSNALKVKGIPSVAYYAVPLHLQGAFEFLGHKAGDFPVAEKIAALCLSLPMHPYLLAEEQETLLQAIRHGCQKLSESPSESPTACIAGGMMKPPSKGALC